MANLSETPLEACERIRAYSRKLVDRYGHDTVWNDYETMSAGHKRHQSRLYNDLLELLNERNIPADVYFQQHSNYLSEFEYIGKRRFKIWTNNL